jgi:hypothetical protein
LSTRQITERLTVRRFAVALTGPPQERLVPASDEQKWRARSLLSAAAFLVWEAFADTLRALWLFVLFAPLAATAPLALQWDIGREEWLHWLRCVITLPCPGRKANVLSLWLGALDSRLLPLTPGAR